MFTYNFTFIFYGKYKKSIENIKNTGLKSNKMRGGKLLSIKVMVCKYILLLD